MNKKEILEIKKQFTPERCNVTRITGCYVNAEKEISPVIGRAFLSLPEEEWFKYLDIFKKSLSGEIGKQLLNMSFRESSRNDYLEAVREDKLKDEKLTYQFFEGIVDTLDFNENVMILTIHGVYDIPGRTKDGLEMEDASEEVYEYILTCVCPVKLSNAGLCYDENGLRNRDRDKVVQMPTIAFLYPAFNDREPDCSSLLYYTKSKEIHRMADKFLGCVLPKTEEEQKTIFQEIVRGLCWENFERIKGIYNDLQEAWELEEENAVLKKDGLMQLLSNNGVSLGYLEDIENRKDEEFPLHISNITDRKYFTITSAGAAIKIDAERTDLIEIQEKDGRKYFVIEANGIIDVNGIRLQ